MAPHSTTS